jgi:hypothetical protein
MSRRRSFAAAVAVLDLTLGQAAEHLGVSYNHLMLVLDGVRTGSARLETGIRAVFDEAKPALLAIVAGVHDAPPPRAAWLRHTTGPRNSTANLGGDL